MKRPDVKHGVNVTLVRNGGRQTSSQVWTHEGCQFATPSPQKKPHFSGQQRLVYKQQEAGRETNPAGRPDAESFDQTLNCKQLLRVDILFGQLVKLNSVKKKLVNVLESFQMKTNSSAGTAGATAGGTKLNWPVNHQPDSGEISDDFHAAGTLIHKPQPGLPGLPLHSSTTRPVFLFFSFLN